MLKPKKKPDYKKVKEAMELAAKLIQREIGGAEGFLMTLHVVREGRLFHHHEASDFPDRDWGVAIINIADQARRIELLAGTGRAKS